MEILGQNTTVKDYFGVRHQFHTPVMYNQTRFYLIKIQKITNVSQQLRKNTNLNSKESKKDMQKGIKSELNPAMKFPQKNTQSKLKQQSKQPFNVLEQAKSINFQIAFQIGCRSSSQKIEIDFHEQQKYPLKNQRISHNKNKEFFKKQQRIIQMLQNNQNFTDFHIFPFQRQEVMTITFKSSESKQEYGYALMPLVPFIKTPQTKHEVEVQLVFFNDKKQIRKDIAAVLHLNLYFLDGFKGNLIVQPGQAFLGRNLAQIGQMSPIIRMFLRENQFSTERIQQGGVRPNWQSSNKFCYFNIPVESAFDELFIYLFYNRQVTMDELIGYYKIDLQNEDLFKEGECMQDFIRQEETQRRKDKIDQKWSLFDKEDSKISGLGKKKKGITNDLANVNKTEKIFILGEQKRKQMQLYQLKWLYSKVQKERAHLVDHIVQKQKTINSQKPLQIVAQKTQNIYKLYQQKEQQILQEFQKTCKINVYQFVGQDRQQLNRRSMTSLKGEYKIKEQIRKMLIKQIKILLKFTQQKMEQIKVPLLYTPVTQEGQDSKTVQVGRLTLKYLFLYQFEIPVSEEQEDNKN